MPLAPRSFVSLACAALSAAAIGCATKPASPPFNPTTSAAISLRTPGIQEASGVLRAGDHLLIVGDDEHGALFDLPLAPDEMRGATRALLDPARLKRLPFSTWELALDLEGVAVLADGRTIVLSEARRAILDESGLVATYDHPFAEFGGRGLEGVAVRRLAKDSSRVAVIWEGGYPVSENVPPPLRDQFEGLAMPPMIVVHDLAAGQRRVLVRERQALAVIELQVPKPPGEEPQAQRFRAPDFVWHDWKETGKRREGFIVLLSSSAGAVPTAGSPEECPRLENGAPRQYCYKWLQRFGLDGKPAGEPYDLDPAFPEELRTANWEGMGWFEEGKSLVFVYDERLEQKRLDPQQAIIVPLPKGW